MKKKNNYFLDLHKKWLVSGNMSEYGLCNSIKKHKSILRRMSPTNENLQYLEDNNRPYVFWGKEKYSDGYSEYTPLRQTIIVLCHELLNS